MSDKLRLSNINGYDSIAVGFDRPKSTAIFFDRIFIPPTTLYLPEDKVYNLNAIPKEICVYEDEDYKFSTKRLLLASSKNDFEVEHFIDSDYEHEYSATINRIYDAYNFVEWCTNNSTPYEIEYDVMLCAEILRSTYGIEVTPVISHNSTFNDNRLTYHDTGDPAADILFEIIINRVPAIVEENLAWEQVLDLRADKNSQKKLRRFKYWANGNALEEGVQKGSH